jgi:hypothetical protein
VTLTFAGDGAAVLSRQILTAIERRDRPDNQPSGWVSR